MTEPTTASFQPQVSDYLQVAAVLAVFTAGLLALPSFVEPLPLSKEKLIQPILGAVFLTALVWLLMVLARNLFILKGLVSADYYVSYTDNLPPEWIERPARAFNNLLQVPILFYVGCLLIILTDRVTELSLAYAWLFVATRLVHASIYILVNNVKFRFTAWMTGCLTVIFLWVEVWKIAM